MAHVERLFSVTWPAGTVLHGTATSGQQLVHAQAFPGEEVSLCTPEGQDVSVPGVVLHGKVGYEVRENGRTLETCDEKDRPNDHDGYATAGADQHTRGSLATRVRLGNGMTTKPTLDDLGRPGGTPRSPR